MLNLLFWFYRVKKTGEAPKRCFSRSFLTPHKKVSCRTGALRGQRSLRDLCRASRVVLPMVGTESRGDQREDHREAQHRQDSISQLKECSWSTP
jgi:hypothetical protein